MSQRIGIFGGTFDPVHLGHLMLASELHHALNLDQTLFVPARRPPHKDAREISDDGDRLAMVRLAIADDARFRVSNIEIDRVGSSYSADTVEQLAHAFSDATLVFLMGADSLRDLPTWHEPERIIECALIGVAGRPGVEIDVSRIILALPNAKDRIFIVPTPQIDISSSDIRARASNSRPIAYHVPTVVEAYIRAKRLYAAPDS
ncbi:nicotinate-nucleotide adenylyltransferase [soil metagenome]